jgi:hypothetical protein
MELKSDLDRFIELYKSFGIECVVNEMAYTGKTTFEIFLTRDDEGFTYVKATSSSKFEVDNSEYSCAIFNENGKFIKQQFCE